jgi:peptide/nickel transport system permease protein
VTSRDEERVRAGSHSHPLLAYALRRIGAGLLTLLAVSIVVFAATTVLPGDAAVAVLGRQAQAGQLEEVRAQLGLDVPAPQRYVEWLWSFLQGDFGASIFTQASVSELIGDRIVFSLVLALVTALFLIPLSLVVGTLAGLRPRSLFDTSSMLGSLIAISLPEFVTGTLLILVFAQELGWFPPVSLYEVGASPLSEPSKLVLPVLTLLAASAAQSIRLVRAGVIEVNRSEYVEMARLRGIRGNRLVRTFVLRNSLVPSIQVLAISLQWLVGGLVVTELVFAYPGVGTALVQAVQSRDIPVVQACSLFIAAAYIGINIVADLLVVFLTPRLRTG